MIRSLKVLSFLAAALGFVGMAYGYEAAFKRWPPLAMLNDGSQAYLPPADLETCFKVRALTLVADPGSVRYWPVCRRWLAEVRALAAFNLRFRLVTGSGALGLAALFLFAFCVRAERPAAKVIRGPRLHVGGSGVSAFAKACNRECRSYGAGIELLPRIAFSRERETRHFLVLGSVGAGKTQTMLRMILQATARGDGVLVLDTKGDLMATLPADGEPPLLAPHDRRSLVWDIAADCETPQDARELAARLIPPSHDPMWSHAAEELFFACIVHLQQTKGRTWTWGDLKAVVTADPDTLKGHVQRHSPGSLRHLDQPDNKTTLSILTTFQTHMRIVSVLAESWPDPTTERFSIRSWLNTPSPYRPLILQHDTRYPALSAIWIGSVLGLLASAVGSPSLADSASRRIWLFLDEFPQLPPIRHFPRFLELGRSKGVAVVIGAQDTAQIRAVYGGDQTQSWFGMVGTKIISRINAGAGAEDISRLIGDQETERRIRSTTHADGKSSVTESVHREIRRVVTPSELGSALDPTRSHVRVLVVGLGDVFRLDLPILKLPTLRPGTLRAGWTLPQPPQLHPPSGAPQTPVPTHPKSSPAAAISKRMADVIRQTRS
jgi:hypothetical protein